MDDIPTFTPEKKQQMLDSYVEYFENEIQARNDQMFLDYANECMQNMPNDPNGW